jgi:protein-tyrosine phosphatase
LPHQSILAGAVVNARDLGGTPLEAGGAVACGKLYRGPPLAYLTAEGCADFAELGIRSVIDLRTPDERLTKPDSACVTETTNVVFSPLPIPYSVSPQDYIADLDATLSMAAALEVLGDEAAYPVYFHCTWGRDRTGVLGAVILLALGATRDAILQEYSLSSSSVGAYPDSLVAVLDEIERRGGIEAYFAAAGISEEQLAMLRTQAISP